MGRGGGEREGAINDESLLMHTDTTLTQEHTQLPQAYRQAQSAPKTENQSVKGGYRGGKRCLFCADLKADVETQ